MGAIPSAVFGAGGLNVHGPRPRLGLARREDFGEAGLPRLAFFSWFAFFPFAAVFARSARVAGRSLQAGGTLRALRTGRAGGARCALPRPSAV